MTRKPEVKNLTGLSPRTSDITDLQKGRQWAAQITQTMARDKVHGKHGAMVYNIQYCLALFDLSRRNWFCISWLVTIIAIGLRNPHAKSESGTGLVLV